MVKIPFKVSARTARLIGRENIATSKGAIIELVKNSSDADSEVSIIYLDNKYAVVPSKISDEEYDNLIGKVSFIELLKNSYLKADTGYKLKEDLSEDHLTRLKNEFHRLVNIYIIDAGEGMTQRIIRDHWMTIGTDNKAHNYVTSTGRIKAGAKGIGRFALDKLGDMCRMVTKFDSKSQIDVDEEGLVTNYNGYIWDVRWSDFDGPFKTIDSVGANLEGLDNIDLKAELRKISTIAGFDNLVNELVFDSGTILKISDLRDDWSDYFVRQLYSDLEVLVPPEEANTFKIYLYSSAAPNEYGLVENSVSDDYDFKLVAESDNNQNVKIKIYRNEYDVDLIDPNFWKREALKNYPYTKEVFKKGVWEKDTSYSKIIPGYKELDDENILQKIGPFKFTLYFMKRTYSSSDLEKFYYNKFNSNERKAWLSKYGGIKLFRDNFRVRPYGEVNNTAFDWLGLGARKSKSPAAVSKPEGGYRVEPDNIAGGISISRIENIDFEDKSSREGLQENKTFQIFKLLLTGIIKVFEEDRAYIAKEMVLFYDEKHSEIKNREQAEKLAQAILEKNRKEKEAKSKEAEGSDDRSNSNEQDQGKSSSSTQSQAASSDESTLIVLAELNQKKTEKIEKLEDEQKVLRGLASSGIVIASFTHELSNLNDVMGSRIDQLQYLLSSKVKNEDYDDVESYLNPFVFMDNMKEDDAKMQSWLKFALRAARKDKRKRKKLSLNSYFLNFKDSWAHSLESREITLVLKEFEEDISLRVFEIDLDSIFNNLVVNSIDAFLRHNDIIKRQIEISLSANEKEIIIDYNDNGPGLSSDIENPIDIFDALFTTKRNKHTGEEEGTGLGMWLVSSVIKDNDGTKKILFPDSGFGLRITFPKKYL